MDDNIDLTIESRFAGDFNASLKPVKWREKKFGELDDLMFIMERSVERMFPLEKTYRFLKQPEVDGNAAFNRLFGFLPQSAYWEELDYGNPDYCYQCGGILTLITASYGICDRCDNEIRSMVL